MILLRLVVLLVSSLVWCTDAVRIEYDLDDLLVDKVVIEPTNNSCTVFYDTGRVRNVANGGDVGNVLKQPPCGRPGAYPCYCDPNAETGIRCPPYCEFESSGGGSSSRDKNNNNICVPVHASVVFGDRAGERQSCECQPAAAEGDENDDDDAVGECEPFVPPVDPNPLVGRNPNDVCISSFGNMEECPALVANQEPIEACGGVNGCYNYCNGRLASCCSPNQPCDVGENCGGFGPTPPVLAFGCRLPLPTIDGLPPPTPPTTTLPLAGGVGTETADGTAAPPNPCSSRGGTCRADAECCSEYCLFGVCQRASRLIPVTKGPGVSLASPNQGGAGGAFKGGIPIPVGPGFPVAVSGSSSNNNNNNNNDDDGRRGVRRLRASRAGPRGA